MILEKKKKKQQQKTWTTEAGLTPSRGNIHVYHNNIRRSSSLYEAAIGREPVHYENTPMQKYSNFFFSHKNENISGKVMIFPLFLLKT